VIQSLLRPDEGVLFVISGPSGVGKSTLIKDAMVMIPGLEFSISATTRPPRRGEIDGHDYYYLTEDEFVERRDRLEFLEHANVYGKSYGTLREPTRKAIASGRSLVLDVDVQGARQLRVSWPDAVTVFVLPPNMDTLEKRLRGRATDADEVVAKRMREVREQIADCHLYDYVLVNDDFATASLVFRGILLAELHKRRRRLSNVNSVRAELGLDLV